MEDEIKKPNIEHYKGAPYSYPGRKWWDGDPMRDDYIRFNWSTGYLEMRMYDYEKLKPSQKNMLYNLALGITSKPKKSKKKKSPNL